MSLNPLEQLVVPAKPKVATPQVSHRWAIVNTVKPSLTVTLAGPNEGPVPAVSLCDCLPGDRVWVEFYDGQLLATHRARTSLDTWTAPTFQNGWVNYDAANAGYGSCAYRREGNFGVLCGLVKNPVTTSTTAIFTLPTSLWPVEARIFNQQSNVGEARINVKENTGEVQVFAYYNGGSGSFVSLEGIRFPLGPTP